MSNSDSGASAPGASAPNDGANSPGANAQDENAQNTNALHTLSDALANAVDTLAPSIVAIHARKRIPASGVVWRNGYVVATDHTIRRERDITVTLNDGRQVAATLIGRDASTDLALLKLADDSIPAAPRAAQGSVRPGNIVLGVGRPGTSITATLGTIHSVGGEWRTWQGGQMSESIRVDMTVHDGFSGSALMDSRGGVIGINSSMLTRGAPATIPALTIDRVVEQLLSTGGRVPRGWLGVGTQPVRLPEKVRTDANLTQEVGLLIVNVASNSPAEQAGLFVGDTLVSLAGTPTREAEDVLTILGPDTVGRTLTARIVRAGGVVEVPVVIGESPHAAPRSDGSDGGSRGGRGPFGGGNPFGGNPFGGNPFGHKHGGRDQGAHQHGRGFFSEEREEFVRRMHEWKSARLDYLAEQRGRYSSEEHTRRAAEAFEKFREFSESFGLGFARGCGPRKPH